LVESTDAHRSIWAIPPLDPDHALRQSALAQARELALAYSEIVPLGALRQGFMHEGQRISFGSFYKGIYRAKEQAGPGALTLMTAAPKPGHPAPYEDVVDPGARTIIYHYRAGSPDQSDNQHMRAARELQAPLIYFLGIDAGQYQVIAPVFVRDDDPGSQTVLLEIGLPHQDTQGEGIVSPEGARREQFVMVARRLDQARFRRDVLRAYRKRCAVCALREPQLVEAAHIVRFSEPDAVDTIINGIALCAIHHLAYDRNLLGIDPSGLVHIGARLLEGQDGPMLQAGLQGFHGANIAQPRRSNERPDPDRLALRFEEFQTAA
jgi:putative restriction endonuclease